MQKIVGILVCIIFVSCLKDKTKPYLESEEWGEFNPTKYSFPNAFSNFPVPDNPVWNVTTVEGVTLGRKLYYDNILSTNGKSCSSCHIQSKSFSTQNVGPNGFNVPAHINLAWNKSFGWLGEARTLDSVALADLEEGNIFLKANNDSILQRFMVHNDYPRLFWKAFGVEITKVSLNDRKKYISYALAQFMRTQISYNSKFDKYLRGEAVLSSDEIAGFSIFMQEDKGDCFHCHGDSYNPLWHDNLFHNNGLDATHTGINIGRYAVTGNVNDLGKFRTPTLRNIELTSPYMHDGRFSTLEQVVNFYSEGLQNSQTIDPLMKKVNQGGAQLNPTEKAQLVAFLKTLTDNTFISDVSLSDPE